MWSNLWFYIYEACVGIKRSGVMIFISLATISASLIIFGMFLLATFNLNNILSFFSSNLEVQVFMTDSITKGEIESFEKQLYSLDGVQSIVFVDKKDAWDDFKKSYVALELSDTYDTNPLPHSFKIKFASNKEMDAIVNRIKSFEAYVDDVTYMGGIAKRLELLTSLAIFIGWGIVGLLTLATLLIIVNTIRLTVIARKDEIAIMQLVGATHKFIRWPFLIEGLIMGVSGSVVSALIVRGSYLFLANKLQLSIPFIPLIFDGITLNLITSAIIVVGTSLGFIGAYISISSTLKSLR